MPGKSLAQQALEERDAPTPDDQPKDWRTKYFKAYDQRAYKYGLMGCSDTELARLLEIDDETLKAWMVERKSFRAAVIRSRESADGDVAHALYRRAVGMTIEKQKAFNVAGQLQTIAIKEELAPDVTAAGLWLSNRQRGKWRSASAGDPAALGFDLGAFVGALAGQLAKPQAQPGDSAKAVEPLDVVTKPNPSEPSD